MTQLSKRWNRATSDIVLRLLYGEPFFEAALEWMRTHPDSERPYTEFAKATFKPGDKTPKGIAWLGRTANHNDLNELMPKLFQWALKDERAVSGIAPSLRSLLEAEGLGFCEDCNRIHPLDEMRELASYGILTCETCYPKKYKPCAGCGEDTYNGCLYVVNGALYCDRCADGNTCVDCAHCGDTIFEWDAYLCEDLTTHLCRPCAKKAGLEGR